MSEIKTVQAQSVLACGSFSVLPKLQIQLTSSSTRPFIRRFASLHSV